MNSKHYAKKRPFPYFYIFFAGILFISILSTGLLGCSDNEKKFGNYIKKAEQNLKQGKLNKAELNLKNAIQLKPKQAKPYLLLSQVFLKQKRLRPSFQATLKVLSLEPDNVQAKIQAARFYLLGKRVADAKKQVQDVLKKDKKNIQAQLLLAEILAQEKDYVPATKQAQQVLALDPKNIEAHILLGRLFLAQLKPELAQKEFEEAARLDQKTPNSLYQLVSFYLSQRKPEQAEETFKEIIKKFPDNSIHMINLARFYIQQRRPAVAEKVLKEAITKKPDDPGLYNILAHFYLKSGRPKLAEETLEDGVKKINDRPEPRLNLGNFYLEIQRPKLAQEVFEQARKDYPKNIFAAKGVAEALYQQGKLDQALKGAGQVLELAKNDIYGLTLKGKILLKKRDFPNVLDIFSSLSKDHPDFADAYYYLALTYFGLGQDKLGQENLATALEKNEKHFLSNLFMAQIRLREKDIEGAQKHARIALQEKPFDLRSLATMGRILQAKGELDNSKEMYAKIQKYYPWMATGYLLQGQLALAQEDFSQAQEQFQLGLKKNPDSPQLIRLMLLTYLGQKQPDQALNFCTDCLKKSKDPKMQSYILVEQGRIQLALKKLDLAKTSFEQAIAKNPNWTIPYMSLAVVHELAGNIDQALADYNQALEKDPNSLIALMSAGILYQQKKDLDKAKEVYKKCIEVNPKFVPALNNLAWILIETNTDLDRALNLAQKAKQLSPEDPAVSDTLGWAFVHKNAYLSACAQFEDALKKMPNKPVIRYHLAVAKFKTKNYKGALEQARKALEVKKDFPEKANVEQLIKEIQQAQAKQAK